MDRADLAVILPMGIVPVGIALMAMSGVARAQFQPMPAPPYYAINPAAPLSPRADAPAQQQILQNYRTQLQQTQRDLLQQNPSGLSRDQFEVGRQLNVVGPGVGGPGVGGPGAVGPGAIGPPSAGMTPSPASAGAPSAAPYR